ncbi:hypothetical protein ACE6H2_015559 [Prunus campanulata]
MRYSSTSEKDSSTATFVEEPKSGRGISTMSRVVKRKIEKVKPVVEFNKDGKPHGEAAVEMQSYIGVLARTRVPLVDKKWKQLPKDVKEQIWEAVQMSYVIGDRYKNLKERREKLEYNHRLSRKGYVGLTDQLVETMPEGQEIDRAVLWKKAREDKSGNIPDPKAAEKAKLIDLSKLDMPPPLLALCQHFQTKLLPNGNEALTIHMPKEVFGIEHDTFLFTEDVLQFGSMVEIGTTVISVYMR